MHKYTPVLEGTVLKYSAQFWRAHHPVYQLSVIFIKNKYSNGKKSLPSAIVHPSFWNIWWVQAQHPCSTKKKKEGSFVFRTCKLVEFAVKWISKRYELTLPHDLHVSFAAKHSVNLINLSKKLKIWLLQTVFFFLIMLWAWNWMWLLTLWLLSCFHGFA